MSKPALIKRHFDRLAQMPCTACGSEGEVCIHHITSDGYKRITRTDTLVCPLCASCHQYGPLAVHTIGHARFCVEWDRDFYLWAQVEFENTRMAA